MVHHSHPFRRLTICVLLLSLIVSPSSSFLKPKAIKAQAISPANQTWMADIGPFRTHVTYPNATGRARLDTLGVVVLEEYDDGALVLVDGDQLADLARLSFHPRTSDGLSQLVEVQANAHPWLVKSLDPVFAHAAVVYSLADTDGPRRADAQSSLRAAMQSLKAEQRAALATLNSLDSDGDGLTDMEETWWCTDLDNVDTDDDGKTDGQEIQTLKDWMNNLHSAPPGETPWPNWPFEGPDCHDKDYDSVPNLAERELGLRMDIESTDRDRYDDGQELFGVTYCPGDDSSCGYGNLPAGYEGVVSFSQLPAWVEVPGNHPFAAAFPAPEIDIVESSLRVETVTVMKTDHTITEGTERSYSTAQTEGSSTSVSNATTWNTWEEISDQRPILSRFNQPSSQLAENYKVHLNTNYTNKHADTSIVNYANIFNTPDASSSTSVFDVPRIFLDIVGAPLEAHKLGVSYRDLVRDYKLMIQTQGWNPFKWDIETAEWSNLDYEMSQCIIDLNSISCSDRARRRIMENAQLAQAIDVLNTNEERTRVSGYSGQIKVKNSDGYYSYRAEPMVVSIDLNRIPTQTRAKGSSTGGWQENTTSEYEEHTITNGEAFSSGESWGTATAIDSSHAADLWFSYNIYNNGTDYAREICNLSFNIYIGDDPNPAATYFVGNDLPGDGCFHNFEPGEEHAYSFPSSNRIELSLEQMKAIDLGNPVRVVMEEYTLGTDDYYHDDAFDAGVMLALEDGIEDGDEAIDLYLIPTWGTETVLDVLARYFPHTTDENGMLIAIWTSENRTDTPEWCNEPRQVGSTLWCKHALSTADWWNVYTDGMGDGTEGFQDTPSAPGSVALFRFNKDTDLDGYSDRSEWRLGTDPEDPTSHPRPELLAGVHRIQSNDYVTATLSLLNTGLYDAYGVEAVLIAPDDSISIINNTVGGSGRVRALDNVVVGSRIWSPAHNGVWDEKEHARPFSTGYYVGDRDRIYTFTALDSGAVSSNTMRLQWHDGMGISGTLNFGSSYASPTPLAVGSLGVKVGLVSGDVQAGEMFTIAARTPRDTFQYRINREPYTPPVVLVSYNDPQGNHRFIVPPEAMALSLPTDDLMAFARQMYQDPGVEIVTTEPFAEGVNTTDLVVNNPTGVTLEDAHLFLEFINITGTVASEIPVTLTVSPGPNVVPVTWDTGVFSPAFELEEDYIVMAFWTDYQGNILDTAGRPLSSFQKDPKPVLAMSKTDVWNFATATQGTLLQRDITLANTGWLDLLTYAQTSAGIELSQTGSRSVGPADSTTYQIALDTTGLPVGSYSNTITFRTSDPDHAIQTVVISGTIITGTADTPMSLVQRPLDWDVNISGSHSQGEWVEFTHAMGPDPETLHPVKMYSQDYAKLWGVGKYATPFSKGTTSHEIFGDGSDGNLTISNATSSNSTRASVTANVPEKSTTIYLASTTGFDIGQEVLIIQSRGSGVGKYELSDIVAVNHDAKTITINSPTANAYSVTDTARAQVIRVQNYENVTISSGGEWRTSAWNGSTGGVLVARIANTLRIRSGGVVNSTSRGYRGGDGVEYGGQWSSPAWSGEGIYNPNEQRQQTWSPDNGGPGGVHTVDYNVAGASGGNGTAGERGYGSTTNPAGAVIDSSGELLFFGGGGGGSMGYNSVGGRGGYGGGIILFFANQVIIEGVISANGGSATLSGNRGGGGGAGGSVKIIASEVTLGTNRITALGGAGGGGEDSGGTGGKGRIRINYCETFSGSTNPSASTKKLDCYIVEQVEASPYNRTRLNLPESFASGQHYAIQYGRRLVHTSAGTLTTTLRVSGTAYLTATLNALVSDVSAGDLTLKLDIGDDGVWDWQTTQNVAGATTFDSPNLAAAFNAYWTDQGAPLTSTLDIPITVYLNKAGQVLITNLQMIPTNSTKRHVRITAQDYSTVTLNLSLGESEMGAYTIAADVGDDGTSDWQWSGNATPLYLTTDNLATAFNAYLAALDEPVADVPVRFYFAPFGTLTMEGMNLTPSGERDVSLTADDISLGAANAIEGERIPITATLHNQGTLDVQGVTAAFYANAPQWGEWYIGSAYVPTVPASGTATAAITWNTLGFTGTIPVRVVLDPYDHVIETDETNNEAATDYTLLSRPDLHFSAITLSNPEPTVGETVVVTLALQNQGQATANAQSVAFEWHMLDADDTVSEAQQVTPLSGGKTAYVTFSWTPITPGPHRLSAQADQGAAVNEYDEGNNHLWRDVYVGFASPILIDSGTSSDTPYTTTLGYGYIDTGQSDETVHCADVADQSIRLDPDGHLVYRFDHLQPNHFYHLDIVMYECDQVGRQQYVSIDGNRIAGPEDLSDGLAHSLSLLVDPALYADHTISVTIDAPGVDGAVVSRINLYDVDYRYADAGSTNEANDPRYPGDRAFGWLNGVRQTNWGTLPEQSVRINQLGREVRYRFDNLKSDKIYQLHLTFWQASGPARIHKVKVDDVDTKITINTEGYEPHYITLKVPPETYTDGSIIVSIARVNASASAMVNEIALEEITLTPEHVQPIAAFTSSETSGYAPLPVQFTDHSRGAITHYQWDFGDGVTDFVPHPLHTFGQPGTYTVTLTTTGPGGQSTISKTNLIEVTRPPVTTTLVHLRPALASAGVDLPLTLSVTISNVDDLGAFDFTMGYSATLVDIQSLMMGAFPGSTGRMFLTDTQIMSQTVTFDATGIGTLPGASGAGDLAHIGLLPKAEGTTLLPLKHAQVTLVNGDAVPLITQGGALAITPCPGDFDNDGDVDMSDVQRVAYRVGTQRGDTLYDPLYDLDNDGDIDMSDLLWIFEHKGTCAPSAPNFHTIARWRDANLPHSARPKFANAVSEQTARLSIRTDAPSVLPGDTFQAAVIISDATDLSAFDFTLAYNPDVVTVLSATLGDFPTSTGREVLSTGLNISETRGAAMFGSYSPGTTPAGPEGDGTLLVLTLRALAPGASDLRFMMQQVNQRTGAPQTTSIESNADIKVAQAGIHKMVDPTGMIKYGDTLTYTLTIQGDPGQQLSLYDPLKGMIFRNFVTPQPGLTYIHHQTGTLVMGSFITGTVTLTATEKTTISFVIHAGISGTLTLAGDLSNRARICPVGGTPEECVWSNEVINSVYRIQKIYLPLIMRNHQ